ncbi:tRNA (guanine(46)-N(7))-methyltransferase TrmB [Chelatococcus reniformis]|uniref:tRNA (guanine-N(7)-)-methyltransferase n=1 Tax=Chelatococcus reniformis TaxID=1494448 RepID=A0A916TZ78_9HYPH|nr:tRNA (guanine(46)-N(7))-methyltransferase TrmB [Chelatococcus reniformis]GGC52367.1 tRNA (guanine-N(7)-)-methyltransferase [Chelatococcus reniformis]
MTTGLPHAGAFHGRRKGHRLRDRQAALMADVLPRLRPPPAGAVAPRTLFRRPIGEVWLEIGFGGGEHLVAQMGRHRDVGFIGCEPFVNGVAKLLANGEADLDRLIIHDGDATELLPRLPAASIDRAFILYPDPWPKRRQRKRRLVSPATLALLARVLKPGATLRFATDIDDYAAWTLARAAASPDFDWPAASATDWTRAWPDWPGTRYEAKAFREGRVPSYLTFVRTG